MSSLTVSKPKSKTKLPIPLTPAELDEQAQLLPSRQKTIERGCKYVEWYFQFELESAIDGFQKSF